jgi:cytochrome c553
VGIQAKLPRFGMTILSLVISISCLTASAETKKNKADKNAKKSNVEKAEIAEKKPEEKIDGSRYILNCSECHGFDGNSLSQEWPSIAGLNKKYITRQLEDFKSGKRKNEEMTLIVREFPSEKELDSLATYFSNQTMVNQNTPASIKNHEFVDLKIGKEIFTGKRIEYGIPACSACHGKDGMGDKEGKYPRLVGQQMDYIILQMEHFRSKERTNDTPAQMQNIAKVMDDEDIASVAAYIAYMGK